MCKDRNEEQGTQRHQETDLRQFDAEKVDGVRAGPYRIVDDPFGQFKREIKQGKQGQRYRKQDQLLPLGIFPDE